MGRVVEKIIGKGNNPAAIPNDVADFLYGSSGLNANTLNVGVANRIKSILGDQSPEWAAVKQGLFSRLVESGQGVTDFGPGKVAQRLNRFLNVDGVELAQALYSPAERDLTRQYANLMRSIEVPQAGANWSNTATFVAPLLQRIGGQVGTIVSAMIGGAIGHATGFPFLGEAAGAGVAQVAGKIGQARAARQVAKQMPLVAEQIRQWQRAVARANRLNSPPSSRGVGLAAANLRRTLANIGVDLPSLHTADDLPDAPWVASQSWPGRPVASQSLPDAPWWAASQRHGSGGVDVQPKLARGGKVGRVIGRKQRVAAILARHGH